ncbi:hypothetical protein SUGI_0796030 [Cryptomeria japonica]|nr:hypothetical protein SUGI_0796030 [Cryptomeria japonica]
MAEIRRSIRATLILVLVLSLFHYSAEEEEEVRCNCSYKMESSKGEKSFEREQIAVMTVFPRKAFNLQIIATSRIYPGVALFWVVFAYLALKYI